MPLRRCATGGRPPCAMRNSWWRRASVRARPHFVADADGTLLVNDGRDAAVAAHRLVSARADGCLHPRAGGARAGPFENDVANLKPSLLQRQQVDPRYDDVA